MMPKSLRPGLVAAYAFVIVLLPNPVRAIANTAKSANAAYVEENADANIIGQHSNPHLQSNRTAIVQLFEWKFADVGEECKNFLGPRGYGGVQLSPVTEHLVVVRTEPPLKRPWWERYHPISYKIVTRSGNEDDFRAMSEACNAVGVRIYVDVVLNHMTAGIHTAANPPYTHLANEPLLGSSAAGDDTTPVNVTTLDYPGIPYTSRDFHKACTLENYSDAHEVRNCQLDGRPDLDHSRAGVRERIVELLNKLVDMGAAGFRVDAAKYMWPVDLKRMFAAVKNLNSEAFDFPANSRPFFYQEVFDFGTDAISKTEYSGYGVVTEYLYAAELSTILSGKVPLSALINWGPAMGFLPHQDALVFVDSHDSQRGLRELGRNHLLTHKQRRKYIMANAFMLAHPYGRIKRIMSSYRYGKNDVDSGPPVMGDDDNIIRTPEFDENGQCLEGWVCEHRWPAIANMIALSNFVSDEQDSVINFQTDGPNHIAFCRGHKAFIAINNDLQLDYVTEVHTCLAEGVYCDVISGGLVDEGNDCSGKRVVVNADGLADIVLPTVDEDDNDENVNRIDDFGVIAIYVGAMLAEGSSSAAASPQEKPLAGGETAPSTNDAEVDETPAAEEEESELTADEQETEVIETSAENIVDVSEEIAVNGDAEEGDIEVEAEVAPAADDVADAVAEVAAEIDYDDAAEVAEEIADAIDDSVDEVAVDD